MHDKLSQAVKLYDNILTEQFVQTSRRQQTLSQPSYPQYNPYQQPQQPLQQPQQQWAPQAVPTSPYQGAYAPQPAASPSAAEQSWVQNSMTYQSQTPSPALSRTQYGQDYSTTQPSPAITQSVQYPMQQQPAYAPSLPPVTLHLPSGPNHDNYRPNSVQHPAMVNQPPAPVPATPVPTSQPQPPAQPTYQAYHNRSLSRSNTINSTAHAQAPQASYANHPHYQQQQQHRVAPAAAPVTMPILPTAPTNAPSAYPLYGPSATVPSVPASEPKEAMLISFD
jgi:hepatocyte growth factor-regulated tyrosine kinase substrate